MLAKAGNIMNVNIEKYISPKILNDLKRALNFKPENRQLRLVRIPVLEFAGAIEKAVKVNPFMPFRPVIFNNIPVDSTEGVLPECVIVADDNTNISKTAIKETEFFKGVN